VQFPNTLTGTFVKRYNRFLVDIRTPAGEVITAHCPNTGAMHGLLVPDAPVVYTPNPRPTAKLGYTWQMIYVDSTWVGINTQNPNPLVMEALGERAIPELSGYSQTRREVKIDATTRLDFALQGPQGLCYVEVKNMHLMRRPGHCEFPDSVTARGAKHVAELTKLAQAGARCVVFMVGQRADVTTFGIAGDIDPNFHTAVLRAQDAGVEFYAYSCALTPSSITLSNPLRPVL
jgi:sugar fermentation stimulation protein A